MRISVALCTYNGEAYLLEQLESMAAQTVLPDELIICDDRSTDGTLQIITEFARGAPFPVHFVSNPENLGSTRNFARAVELCSGEMIVLADQDDVWKKNKLERLAAMMNDQQVGFAFSNADVVDEALRPLGYSLWESLPGGHAIQQAVNENRLFERLLQANVVTGATMAFRAQYKDLVLPIPANWVHDAWIALLISAIARCALTDEPLIAYRQHSRQQIGAWRFSIMAAARQVWQRSLKSTDLDGQAAGLEGRVRSLAAEEAFAQMQERIGDLHAKAKHFRARARSRAAVLGRIPLIVSELVKGRYHKYSLGWLTVARDLLAV